MQAGHLKQQLGELLAQQVQCVKALVALLEQEREALSVRDGPALLECAVEKDRKVATLGALERDCARLLSSAHFDPDVAGLNACIAWCDTDAQLYASRNELLDLLALCRHQNRLNGGILALKHQAVSRAMDMLSGHRPDDKLYGRHGRETNQSGGHSIAQV